MSAMSVGVILTRWVVNSVGTKLGTALKLWMCQVNSAAVDMQELLAIFLKTTNEY